MLFETYFHTKKIFVYFLKCKFNCAPHFIWQPYQCIPTICILSMRCVRSWATYHLPSTIPSCSKATKLYGEGSVGKNLARSTPLILFTIARRPSLFLFLAGSRLISRSLGSSVGEDGGGREHPSLLAAGDFRLSLLGKSGDCWCPAS